MRKNKAVPQNIDRLLGLTLDDLFHQVYLLVKDQPSVELLRLPVLIFNYSVSPNSKFRELVLECVKEIEKSSKKKDYKADLVKTKDLLKLMRNNFILFGYGP
jgi:hypothetical protein